MARERWPRDASLAGVLAFVGFACSIDPARARPLQRRQGGRACGWSGSRCSSRRRSGAKKTGRDRVRDRRDPRGRLREDQRDEPGRGPPRGGPRPRLPRAAGLEADRGDRGRAGRELRAGVRAAVRLLRGDRAAGRRTRVVRPVDEGLPGGGRAAARATSSSRWTASGRARPALEPIANSQGAAGRAAEDGCRAATPATLTCRRATASALTLTITPDATTRPPSVDDADARGLRATSRARTTRCRSARRSPRPRTASGSSRSRRQAARRGSSTPEKRKQITGIVGSYETTRQTILDDVARRRSGSWRSSRCRWRS